MKDLRLTLLPPIAAVLLTAAFLLQLPAHHEPVGFPLDDAWIHAVYARNLAMHGEWAFNRGEPSTGTTSPLWTLVLAAAHVVMPDPVAAGVAMGALAFLVFIIGWQRLLGHLLGSPRAAALAALCTAASGITVWWALSGMETMLFLALGVWALTAWHEHRTLVSGILGALLLLARPEGLLLPLVLAGFAGSTVGRRTGTQTSSRAGSPMGATTDTNTDENTDGHGRWEALAALLLPALAALALLVAWNLAIAGTPWTSTLQGRRWLARSGDFTLDPVVVLGHAFHLVRQWSYLLARAAVPKGNPVFAAVIVASVVAAALALAIARVRKRQPDGLARATRDIRHLRSAALVWLLLHIGAYVLVMPVPGHAGRYQAMIPPAVTAVTAWLIMRALAGSASSGSVRDGRGSSARGMRGARTWGICMTAPAVILLCAQSTIAWMDAYRVTVHTVESVHVVSAKWAAANLPGSTRLAAYDIGALGFFSGMHIIDCGGLVDARAVPYMRRHAIDEWMLAQHADAVAMVRHPDDATDSTTIPRLLGYNMTGRLHLSPLFAASVPRPLWERGILLTNAAYPRMEICRIFSNEGNPGLEPLRSPSE